MNLFGLSCLVLSCEIHLSFLWPQTCYVSKMKKSDTLGKNNMYGIKWKLTDIRALFILLNRKNKIV